MLAPIWANAGDVCCVTDTGAVVGAMTTPPKLSKPSPEFMATRRAEQAAAAASAARAQEQGGVGIALSGGGNRAYTCAYGVLRGLAVKGVLDDPPTKLWMSGVSGGGWATAAYCFNQIVPRDELLDVSRAKLSPSELTVEACSTVEPRSMGQPVSTKPMTHKNMLLSMPRSCFASCLSRQPFGAISWIRNIWQVYLAPFGVPQGRLFAASAAEVDAKGRRSDYIFPADYCAATPLIGVTMYGPTSSTLGPIPGCTMPGCIGMRRVDDFIGSVNAADTEVATVGGPTPEEVRSGLFPLSSHVHLHSCYALSPPCRHARYPDSIGACGARQLRARHVRGLAERSGDRLLGPRGGGATGNNEY